MAQIVSAHMMQTLDGFSTGLNQTRERPFGTIDPRQLARFMFEDGDNNRAEIDAIVDQGAFVMATRAATPETRPTPAMAATTSQSTSSIGPVYRVRRAPVPSPGSAIA